jgi:mono/diheme cytochrome c family protein
MKTIARSTSAGLLAAAVLLGSAVLGARSEDIEPGKTAYVENCAVCHGADGKGSVAQTASLKAKPGDLTLLAKRNHGIYDAAAVYQKIDGRNVRSSHRNSEMPIWGCRHNNPPVAVPVTAKPHKKLPKRVVSAMKNRETELDSLLDLPCGSEEAVRTRILSIVEYLALLQAK